MSFYSASGLLSLAAIPAVILLAGLIVRNPLAPAWLQTEAAATGAGLALTAGVCVALMHALSGLVADEWPYAVIAVVIAGVPTASAVLLWKAFNIGARLARADAGFSPFERPSPAAQEVRKPIAQPARSL